LRFRGDSSYTTRRLNSADPGEGDIHQNKVWFEFLGFPDGILAVCSLTNHVQSLVVGKKLTNGSANKFVVIYNKQTGISAKSTKGQLPVRRLAEHRRQVLRSLPTLPFFTRTRSARPRGQTCGDGDGAHRLHSLLTTATLRTVVRAPLLPARAAMKLTPLECGIASKQYRVLGEQGANSWRRD
jgi:hypothetical protein